MPYFDPVPDAWMIRRTHRDAQDLTDALRKAEDEIIRHYTDDRRESAFDYPKVVGDFYRYVHLRTYDPDPAAATVAPEFRAAMKHAIAEAAVWIIEQWTELEPLVRDEAGKAKTRTFRGDAHDPLPASVYRWLEDWDTRTELYTI